MVRFENVKTPGRGFRGCGKTSCAVILSPFFGRRTPVVRSFRAPRELQGSFAALRMTVLGRFSAASLAPLPMGEGLNGPLGPEGASLQGLKPLNPTQVLRRG